MPGINYELIDELSGQMEVCWRLDFLNNRNCSGRIRVDNSFSIPHCMTLILSEFVVSRGPGGSLGWLIPGSGACKSRQEVA